MLFETLNSEAFGLLAYIYAYDARGSIKSMKSNETHFAVRNEILPYHTHTHTHTHIVVVLSSTVRSVYSTTITLNLGMKLPKLGENVHS